MRKRSPLRSKFDFDRQDKRAIEKEYFDSFQFLEPEIKRIPFVQSEAPDFCSVEGEHKIGVEVTRLFQRSARVDVESAKDRILDDARTFATATNLPPADVTLFFSFEGKMPAKRRRWIAEATVRFVASHMPPEGDSVSLEGFSEQPPEVDLILVNRVLPEPTGQWRWGEAGKVELDPTAEICGAIARKESKLAEYSASCSECWLLLVADSFRPSGKLAINDTWIHRSFDSSFARIYFLDFGRGHLRRLLLRADRDRHSMAFLDR